MVSQPISGSEGRGSSDRRRLSWCLLSFYTASRPWPLLFSLFVCALTPHPRPLCVCVAQGNCIVHHLFGHDVVQRVREHYADAFYTAHLEVSLSPEDDTPIHMCM